MIVVIIIIRDDILQPIFTDSNVRFIFHITNNINLGPIKVSFTLNLINQWMIIKWKAVTESIDQR